MLGLLVTMVGCGVAPNKDSDASLGVAKLALCAPGGVGPFACGESCLCAIGQAGCLNDADCEAGSMCRKNVGGNYGLSGDVNVCEAITNCPRFTARNQATFCTPACPCGEEEGGCTYGDDTTCDGPLTCFLNRGPVAGMASNMNLCLSACPPFDPAKPNAAFCNTQQCPCGLGEGDCDKNSECTAGICGVDNGAAYGLPASWEVCECPAFSTAAPRADFCRIPGCGLCGVGQGNCENDSQCAGGLVCTKKVGAKYGLPSLYGVCEDPNVCPAFDVNFPSQTFCTAACPCGEAEGGCEFGNDLTCRPGLTCLRNQGPHIGLSSAYHLCMSACPPFDVTKQNPAFCTTQCPCGLGEGDCDQDGQCSQGVCVEDNGATYGLPPDWEACECPAFTTAAPRIDFCSIPGCGLCAAGQGDCDSDSECAGGLLCLPLGPQYNLPPSYDVCSAPLLTALTTSAGALTPSLAVGVFSYSVDAGLSDTTITLTPTVSSGATVTIEGSPVTSGQPWVSPTLALGENPFALVVSQGGIDTNYTITVSRTDLAYVQEAYAKASNTAPGAQFGASIAISGDTAVVGAPITAAGGAVYVFVRSGGVWSQQALLTASDAATGDDFGGSVAISGDTIVVGADLQDTTAADSGAVYVFTRTSGVWSQRQILKASNPGAGDQFGISVSVDGNTVAVGAFHEDTGGADSGATYVFTRSGNLWSQQANLKASNAEAGDLFGRSVAVSGNTLTVGANGEDSAATGVGGNQGDNSASNSGAAYVFTRSGSVWSQQAYLKASNSLAGIGFGLSVGLSGDTAVVGAYLEDTGADDSGAAYVFTRTGSVWSQQAFLKATTPGKTDRFGYNLAVAGDLLIVGASRQDSNATGINGDEANGLLGNSGAAYVFSRSGGVWSQEAYVKASTAGQNDRFGWSVGVSSIGFAVGARFEDSSATGIDGDESDDSSVDSGAAYFFR